MLLTEKAARKKRCAPLGGKCTASSCMGWRWATMFMVGEFPQKISGKLATEFGYCGLAGLPQEDVPHAAA